MVWLKKRDAEQAGSKSRQVKNDIQKQGLCESDRVAVLLENTYLPLPFPSIHSFAFPVRLLFIVSTLSFAIRVEGHVYV